MKSGCSTPGPLPTQHMHPLQAHWKRAGARARFVSRLANTQKTLYERAPYLNPDECGTFFARSNCLAPSRRPSPRVQRRVPDPARAPLARTRYCVTKRGIDATHRPAPARHSGSTLPSPCAQAGHQRSGSRLGVRELSGSGAGLSEHMATRPDGCHRITPIRRNHRSPCAGDCASMLDVLPQSKRSATSRPMHHQPKRAATPEDRHLGAQHA
jgi:hypothetical protein